MTRMLEVAHVLSVAFRWLAWEAWSALMRSHEKEGGEPAAWTAARRAWEIKNGARRD